MSKLTQINPFKNYGIANYEQFKQYPFLLSGVTLDLVDKRVSQSINEVKNGYELGERLILIGQRGLGKTSALFFIKEKLDKGEVRNFFFSTLIEDSKHFNDITNENLSNVLKKPVYLLVDFPDTIDNQSFKKFLLFLWDLISSKDFGKINLLFSMNHSHFNKSFSLSEIFGKFTTLRLEPFNYEETVNLISSRFPDYHNFFDDSVLQVIYSYSKGIPRNVISACCLLFDLKNGQSICEDDAKKILAEKYIEQVINDRVENFEDRIIFKQMIEILKNKFNGNVISQMDYVKVCQEFTGIGRISVTNKIEELVKFGIIHRRRGGEKRLNKILSLE